jgi:hypothetical protein
MATIESTRVDPHSIAAELFQRRIPPQFAFSMGEQDLLELALDGMDDATAANAINISLPAVKHRWASIFERVSTARPDVCPRDVGMKRGTQKRQRILAHVRKHPEELRPFDFSMQANK